MSIRGELTELDVPGLMQLIATHGKTGTLAVQDPDDHEVHVLFEAGDIVGALVPERGEAHRVGELLVKAEVLAPADLEWALREQKLRGVRLGDLLVAEGKIAKQDLADILRVQIYETVFRVFTWRQGKFEFRAGTPEFERGLVGPIKTDHLLMDSFRMVDEWPQIKKWVPSFDRIVEKTEIGEKVRRPLTPRGGDPGGGLSDPEWLMLDLAQEHLSVQRAIYRSRIGEFEACKALKGLQEKGLVRLVVAGEALTKRLIVGQRRLWNAGLTFAVLNGVLIAAFVVTAVALLAPVLAETGSGRTLELLLGPDDDGLARAIVEGRARAVTEALALYKTEHGKFPDDLTALVRDGLASGIDLELASRSYRYAGPETGALLPIPAGA